MAYYAAIDENSSITGFYDTKTFRYDPQLGLPSPLDYVINDVVPQDVPDDAPVPDGYVRLTQAQWDTHMQGGGTWKWVNDDLELQE